MYVHTVHELVSNEPVLLFRVEFAADNKRLHDEAYRAEIVAELERLFWIFATEERSLLFRELDKEAKYRFDVSVPKFRLDCVRGESREALFNVLFQVALERLNDVLDKAI